MSFLKGIREEGKILVLDDGSEWLIDPASITFTRFWLLSQRIDPINIETEGFTHILVNSDLLDAVKAANLKKDRKTEQSHPAE